MDALPRRTIFRPLIGLVLAGYASSSWANTAQVETLLDGPALRPYTPPDATAAISGEFLLRVQMDTHTLSEGMLAYDTPAGFLLPLGELARLLEFPIHVNPANGSAQGWFIREKRDFHLAKRRAVVAGKSHEVEPDELRLDSLDIFVPVARLSQWLPLDFELQRSEATLKIAPRETLPLQTALLRKQRQSQKRRSAADVSDLPQVKPEYRAATVPYVDVSMNAQSFGQQRDNQASSSLLLAGDLLYMSARGFVAIRDQQGLNNARLTLERKDVDGAALGQGLGVTEFSVGDSFTRPMPLLAESSQALGLQLSNQPLNRVNDLETITLRGDAPPGWDVELYRDQQLIEFTVVNDDGLYEFVDIPLRLGANPLSIVVLGPQGQRQQIDRSYYLGPGVIPSGKAYYRVFAGQHETQLLPDDFAASAPDEAATRVQSSFEYGLRPGLSLAAAYAHLPVQGEQRNQFSLGLRGQVRGLFARMDAALDAQAGRAGRLGLLTRIGQADLSLSYTLFEDFVSEVSLREGVDLRQLGQLQLAWPLRWGGRPLFYNSLSGEYARFENASERWELSHRLSFRLGAVAAAHSLDYRQFANQGFGDNRSSDGQWAFSGRLGQRHSLQANARYQIRPQWAFQSFSFTSNTRLDQAWSLRLEASRSYRENQETRMVLSLSQRGYDALWSVGIGYSDRYRLLFNASLSFSFGRNPANGGWMMDARSLARSGLIHARSFLDANNNGRQDGEESGIAEAGFLARGDDVKTDQNGHATLPGFAAYRPAALRLDESSLPDPFWAPKTSGYDVVTRPGRVTAVDYAVLPTGEVEGVVYLVDGDEQRSLANVLLVLSDPQGRQYRTRSSYDGFFLFERIPLGRYQLVIDPQQLKGKELRATPAVSVAILQSGDVDGGHSMMIRRGNNEPLAVQNMESNLKPR